MIISTEICSKCAECCKKHPFVDISIDEITALETLTGLHPDVFTNKKEKLVEEYFLQFQDNGYCFFLTENNGIFSCSVYEARPEICRKYPSEFLQKKACDANRAPFLTASP